MFLEDGLKKGEDPKNQIDRYCVISYLSNTLTTASFGHFFSLLHNDKWQNSICGLWTLIMKLNVLFCFRQALGYKYWAFQPVMNKCACHRNVKWGKNLFVQDSKDWNKFFIHYIRENSKCLTIKRENRVRPQISPDPNSRMSCAEIALALKSQ